MIVGANEDIGGARRLGHRKSAGCWTMVPTGVTSLPTVSCNRTFGARHRVSIISGFIIMGQYDPKIIAFNPELAE